MIPLAKVKNRRDSDVELFNAILQPFPCIRQEDRIIRDGTHHLGLSVHRPGRGSLQTKYITETPIGSTIANC